MGRVYVERAFPPQTKVRAGVIIENLRAAVRMRIESLEWMGSETKAQALAKLDAFATKIGYPDEWRDDSELVIGRESYLANVRAANVFEMGRSLDKVGKEIDRGEWNLSPKTVNAGYNPVLNEIVFPAAIMQPPFFDGEMDDAVNYGPWAASSATSSCTVSTIRAVASTLTATCELVDAGRSGPLRGTDGASGGAVQRIRSYRWAYGERRAYLG